MQRVHVDFHQPEERPRRLHRHIAVIADVLYPNLIANVQAHDAAGVARVDFQLVIVGMRLRHGVALEEFLMLDILVSGLVQADVEAVHVTLVGVRNLSVD